MRTHLKQFLNFSLFFLIPIFTIGISSEILLRNIPNDYLYKRQYLDKNSNSIKILILGSSHSYYNINPIYFNAQAFNAGYVSQSLNYDYKILQQYNGKLKNLQYIILPISYFSLFYKLETGLESWRMKNYLIYYGMNSSNINNYTEILGGNFYVNIRRIESYYLKKENNITCSETGWGQQVYASNYNKIDILNNGKTIVKLHTMGDDNVFQENLNILIAIVKFAKERNIKIILYTSPAYHTYFENFDKRKWDNTISAVNKICYQYDNTFYFNLLTDKSFNEVDFFDAHHLNDIGAEHLTKKLNSLILNIKPQTH